MPNEIERFEQSSIDLFEREGDVSDELVAHYIPRVRAFVRARLGDRLRRQEAESDIVQSVFRRLVEQKSRLDFDVESQFRSWLFTTALNTLRERARFWGRDKRGVNRTETLGPDGDLEDLCAGYSGVFTPSRIVAAREQVERLECALEALPDDYREVIAMARIARLPHAEIGEHMGRSADAVRQLLGRALRTLAEQLSDASSASEEERGV